MRRWRIADGKPGFSKRKWDADYGEGVHGTTWRAGYVVKAAALRGPGYTRPPHSISELRSGAMAVGICYAFGNENEHGYCGLQSKRAVPSSLPGRGDSARASVDDAAGGAVFAGVSGNSGEAWVFGGLQDAGAGGGGVSATVSAAGRGCGDCVR